MASTVPERRYGFLVSSWLEGQKGRVRHKSKMQERTGKGKNPKTNDISLDMKTCILVFMKYCTPSSTACNSVRLYSMTP